MSILDGANVLILGGTGSLGQRLFYRIMSKEMGEPNSLSVLSRDEAKQHHMRLDFLHAADATDDIIYRGSVERVKFVIGDVRNMPDMRRAVSRADVIFHAAALKQVPTCEYFGSAAVDTNVYGAINLVRAVSEGAREAKHVIGISTDKACKPVNVMGMTKALQERILIQGNLDAPWCRFVNVRYGNVMASRGSVIPFFLDLVRTGKPIPLTHEKMTRYLLTLDQSVDLVFNALENGRAGETMIPRVPSATISNVALAVAENDSYPVIVTGIRPGEKLHEVLVSEEERPRTEVRGNTFVVHPILPELRVEKTREEDLPFSGEYTSSEGCLDLDSTGALLREHDLTTSTAPSRKEIYR